MKRLSAVLFLILSLLFTTQAQALEVVRQKNVASYIVFPIMKNDGTLISSATGLDSEIDAYADGSAPDGFADCTNEATEIGSTGQYYLSLTNTELNNDYAIIQVKSSSDGAITQTILIRTMVGDPLLLATTDDGGVINVTSGKIDEVSTLTGNTAQTGDAYAVVNNGTYGNSALNTVLTSTGVKLSSGTGSGQISLSSGAVLLQATQTGVTIPTVTTLTNAPSDSSGVTTLLSRLTSTRAGYLDNLTNLDGTVSSRLAGASYTAPDNSGITNIYNIVNNGTYGNSALNTAISGIPAATWNLNISAYSGVGYAGTYLKTLYDNYTAARAVKLDNLDAAISTRSTYAGADTSGTTTLLSRLSADRAGYLDKLNVAGSLANTDNASSFKADVSNLDVAVSSRLAGASYTAPDNTTIGNIAGILYNGIGYATCPTNKSFWDYLDAVISSRSSHSAANVAAVILATPANKIATDADGKVTVANPGTTVY